MRQARGTGIDLEQELRWDLVNLLEGYFWRMKQVSRTLRVALDVALDLVDAHGRAKRLPLGGVEDRRLFMALANYESSRTTQLSANEALEFAYRKNPNTDLSAPTVYR